MSQSSPKLPFDFVLGREASPSPADLWPPADWVKLTAPGPRMRVIMHRSGAQVFRQDDGAICVFRGYCAESFHVAGVIENFLWGTGYSLTAGGRAEDRIAVYRLPR